MNSEYLIYFCFSLLYPLGKKGPAKFHRHHATINGALMHFKDTDTTFCYVLVGRPSSIRTTLSQSRFQIPK